MYNYGWKTQYKYIQHEITCTYYMYATTNIYVWCLCCNIRIIRWSARKSMCMVDPKRQDIDMVMIIYKRKVWSIHIVSTACAGRFLVLQHTHIGILSLSLSLSLVPPFAIIMSDRWPRSPTTAHPCPPAPKNHHIIHQQIIEIWVPQRGGPAKGMAFFNKFWGKASSPLPPRSHSHPIFMTSFHSLLGLEGLLPVAIEWSGAPIWVNKPLSSHRMEWFRGGIERGWCPRRFLV